MTTPTTNIQNGEAMIKKSNAMEKAAHSSCTDGENYSRFMDAKCSNCVINRDLNGCVLVQIANWRLSSVNASKKYDSR